MFFFSLEKVSKFSRIGCTYYARNYDTLKFVFVCTIYYHNIYFIFYEKCGFVKQKQELVITLHYIHT